MYDAPGKLDGSQPAECYTLQASQSAADVSQHAAGSVEHACWCAMVCSWRRSSSTWQLAHGCALIAMKKITQMRCALAAAVTGLLVET